MFKKLDVACTIFFVSLGAITSLGAAVSCGGSSKGDTSSSRSDNPDAGDAAVNGASGSANGGKGGDGNEPDGSPKPDTGKMPNFVPPSPELLAGCDALCDKLAEPMCENANSRFECLGVCAVATSIPACEERYEALFDCAEDSSAACNDEGGAELAGCGLQQLVAFACFAENVQNTVVSEACDSYCDQVEEAACPSDGPRNECELGCGLLSAIAPACSMKQDVFLACSAGATLECDDGGAATPKGCDGEALSFYGCVLEAAGEAGLATAP